MKTPEKSRFGKLVAYLLDLQGKKTRVGEVTITNCVSTDTTWAVREIAATQRLLTRAPNPIGPIICSFRSEPAQIPSQNVAHDRGAFLQGAGLR